MPESGFPDAGAMFDAADHVGGLWGLERLTREVVLAGAAGLPAGVLLFLNCTPAVFADRRFPGEVRDAVEHAGLMSDRVVLEITERGRHPAGDVLSRQVSAARAMGFGVALDDVGAGESGLLRLISLRPNWIKLDRGLCHGVDADAIRRNLVSFLVGFARSSDVQIVAEGIERREELDTLASLGVRHAQGFFLGRPGRMGEGLSAEACRWLADRRVQRAA